jgi:hypothetical protein
MKSLNIIVYLPIPSLANKKWALFITPLPLCGSVENPQIATRRAGGRMGNRIV